MKRQAHTGGGARGAPAVRERGGDRRTAAVADQGGVRKMGGVAAGEGAGRGGGARRAGGQRRGGWGWAGHGERFLESGGAGGAGRCAGSRERRLDNTRPCFHIASAHWQTGSSHVVLASFCWGCVAELSLHGFLGTSCPRGGCCDYLLVAIVSRRRRALNTCWWGSGLGASGYGKVCLILFLPYVD